MTYVNRWYSRSLLVVVSTFPVGCATRPEASDVAQQASALDATYSGEALFKGIFFHSGPAAALVPDVGKAPRAPELKTQAGRAAVAARLTELAAQVRSAGVTAGASRLEHIAEVLNTPGATADQLAARIEQVASSVRDDGLSLSAAAAVNRLMNKIKSEDGTFFERFGRGIQSGNPLLIQSTLSAGSKRFLQAATSERSAREAAARPVYDDEDTATDVDVAAAVDTAEAASDAESEASAVATADATSESESDAAAVAASESESTDTSAASDEDSATASSLDESADESAAMIIQQDLITSQAQSFVTDQSRGVIVSTAVQLDFDVFVATMYVGAAVRYVSAIDGVPLDPSTPADALKRDLIVNALASQLTPVASPAVLAAEFPMQQFR